MNQFYDVAVIGGGPAGLMAAAIAAESGASVVLIEKNEDLGRKLLLTGGTRGNLTNLQMTKDRLVELFGPNGTFLYSGLSIFGVAETLQYFNEHGLPTKEEKNGCVFTASDNARDLVRLFDYILLKHNVRLLTGSPVVAVIAEGKEIQSLSFPDGTVRAKKYIICTGGLSFPGTGSTGDGLAWAKQLGHSIIEPRPALAPLTIADDWVKELQGLSLPQTGISVWQQKKIKTFTGDLLFTERGLSGPVIHNASRLIGGLLQTGSVTLTIDCLPAETGEMLEKRLQIELANNAKLANYLETFIPKRLAAVIVRVAGIAPDKVCNGITKQERKDVVRCLKELPCTVAAVAGFDKAMITAGGVSLKEIESKTMQSKIIHNLYFAGEVLDLDGPSGGYNLQVCWTTGYCVGVACTN